MTPEKGFTMNAQPSSPHEAPAPVVDPLQSNPARVARYAEASTLTIEVIAAMWRGHAACTWVSTGHDVVWSCGIIHPRPIHMQPTTRDWHFAALLKTQIDADMAVADEERAALVAEVERLRRERDWADGQTDAAVAELLAAEAKVAKVEAHANHLDAVADGRASMIQGYYNQGRPDDALRLETEGTRRAIALWRLVHHEIAQGHHIYISQDPDGPRRELVFL